MQRSLDQREENSESVDGRTAPEPVIGGSVLVNAAHRFAAQTMTGPPEDYRHLFDEFLKELLAITGDDRVIVLRLAGASSARVETEVCRPGFVVERTENVPWELLTTWFDENDESELVIERDHADVSHRPFAGLVDLGKHNISSLLMRTLVGRGVWRGVLLLVRHDSVGDWSEALIGDLSDVAAVIGSVLEHRRTAWLLEGALRRNRRLTQRLVEIQEQERRRLAQELHDETGQYLAALKSDATLVGKRIPAGDELLNRAAGAVAETAGHIYEVVYGVMGRLCAVDLDDLGLSGALGACVTNSRLEDSGVHCELHLAGDLDTLDDTTSMTVYRIVQESLTNISKYAHAKNVEIRVERLVRTHSDRRQRYRLQSSAMNSDLDRVHVDTLEITVIDDGQGMINTEAKGGGFGISGMRERLQALGGNFNIESEVGKGTRVRGTLSLSASADRGNDDGRGESRS